MTQVRKGWIVIGAAFVLALVGTTTLVDAYGGDDSFIHACVNPSNGEVKIVASDGECRPPETPLHWAPALAAHRQPSVRFLALLSGSEPIQTSSATFEDMPGMTATFQTAADGCVTAALSISTQGGLVLRILLDGDVMEGHGTVTSSEPPSDLIPGELAWGGAAAASYSAWKCGVSRGVHTVKVEWKMSSPLGGRTLVVQGY